MEREGRYRISIQLEIGEGVDPWGALQKLNDAFGGESSQLRSLYIEDMHQLRIKGLPTNMVGSPGSIEPASIQEGEIAGDSPYVAQLKAALTEPHVESYRPVFSTRQVLEMLPELKKEFLYYMESRGYTHPHLVFSSGQRKYRSYSLSDVVKIGIIQEYRRRGFLLKIAAQRAQDEVDQLLASKLGMEKSNNYSS